MRPSERIHKLAMAQLPPGAQGYETPILPRAITGYLEDTIPAIESRLAALESRQKPDSVDDRIRDLEEQLQTEKETFDSWKSKLDRDVASLRADLEAVTKERYDANELILKLEKKARRSTEESFRDLDERHSLHCKILKLMDDLASITKERDFLKDNLSSKPSLQLPDGWRWFDDKDTRGLERIGDLRGRDAIPFRQWKNGGYWLWFGSAGVDDVELHALAFALDKLGIAKLADPTKPAHDWSRLLACGEAIEIMSGQLCVAHTNGLVQLGRVLKSASKCGWVTEKTPAAILQLARYLEGGV